MAFVKAIKTKAYFKRYQTKYRRRREGRTDYAQRRNLVKQDKNKYTTAKYRLVVRITNTKVICQIIYATIQGDRVVSCADSTELAKYGVKVGLKNYAAAYATGLLVARRTLKSLGLDEACVGQKVASGEEYHVSDDFEGERRPFKCVLDIGLQRTSVGARIFGALKGAADGGLDIPYSSRKFPGFTSSSENKEGEYDANVHRDRIFGKHVATYMTQLKKSDEAEYNAHFKEYLAAGVTADKIEEMYKKAHAAIRAKPEATPKVNKAIVNTRSGHTIKTAAGNSYIRNKALNLKQRKARVMERIRNAQHRAANAAEEE
jgi:large subunit ribosomal protein L5e